ncbi:MAG: hypothetical protein ACE5KF_11225 [Kiloniellaceae bacterium]
MPYVARDRAGRIVKVSARKTKEASEKLAANDPELRPFQARHHSRTAIEKQLIASDLELIRVLEDLIAVLIDKRIIMLTDLPNAAQEKLARRYELRSKLADLGGIVAESEEIFLP